MIEAGKETADPLMETKILDVCQALIIKAKMDASNFQPNPVLAKIREVCEVALNKAHGMGVIKTYDQAVEEYEEDDRGDAGGVDEEEGREEGREGRMTPEDIIEYDII